MKLNYFLTNKLLNLKITSTDKPFLTDDKETMTLTSLDDGEIQKKKVFINGHKKKTYII